MINISAEDAKLFQDNGFTKDQIGATINHYREQGLSDDDIQAKINNRLSSFSKVTSKKGVDLTPSGWAKEATKRGGALLTAPFVAAKQNIPFGEAYKNELAEFENAQKALETPLSKANDFLLDTATYSALPALRIVKGAGLLPNIANMGVTGAYQGAITGGLESLKQQGDLSGIGTGTGIGASVGGGLPVVGKVAQGAVRVLPASGNVVAQSIARLKPETLKRAVQPDSKALDITADEAQNYLANITERVRTGYDDLLSKRGEAISNAEENLRLLEDRINAEDLINDVGDVFGKNQGERINTVRDLTGNLENDLLDLIARGTDETGTIAPIDLQRIKQQVGEMTNWADTTRPKIQNKTLEQIYGKFNKRLIDISPELAMANKEYAKIKNFQNNEGLKRVLRPGDNIDSASTALKNYNTTVTKGNTSRNIQDLENALVNEGQAPFIRDIDDINAVMDLNNARTTGDSWLANIATQATRPALKLVRELNRKGIPIILDKTGQAIQRILPANIARTAPILYGGVEYNERY